MSTLEQHINNMFKASAEKAKELQAEATAAFEAELVSMDNDIRTVVDLRNALYRGSDMESIAVYISALRLTETTLSTIAVRYNLSGTPARISGQEKRVNPTLAYMVAEFERTSVNLIEIIRDRRKKLRAAFKIAMAKAA